MEIGGYFGLEISSGHKSYHSTPYKLKSGRAAISFIIKYLKPKLVYVPYYTCNALLEPFGTLDTEYKFYAINEHLEIADPPELKSGELLIYINYYDVKRDYAERLSQRYRDQLVVDCTQAFFLKGNNVSWYLNSSRKFFGVPDGCDLYIPAGHNLLAEYNRLTANTNYITEHLTARFKGETQLGYDFFCQNEQLNGQGVFKMSSLSANLLSNVNYKKASENRQRNFRYMHQQLSNTNLLVIDDPFSPAPSFYPYLPHRAIDKKLFWDNKIFIPNFWTDCLTRDETDAFAFEKELTRKILPIPIDHRYLPADFDRLLSLLDL